MVIVSGNYGQLCNQLFRLAHHIANGIQYNYEINCSDFEFKHLFPKLNEHDLISTKPVLSKLQRTVIFYGTREIIKNRIRLPIRKFFNIYGYCLIDKPHSFDSEDKRFIDSLRQRTIAIDWRFRDYNALNTQRIHIKQIFSFSDKVYLEANSLIKTAHQAGNLVVGVHIRRGDYIKWNNGKYYYSDDVYTAVMKHFTNIFPEVNMSFILCSNEEINIKNYKGLNIVVSKSHYTVDLEVLGRCDFIIGPPSTFSSWASFIGSVPLFHMHNNFKMPVLEDFKIAIG